MVFLYAFYGKAETAFPCQIETPALANSSYMKNIFLIFAVFMNLE